MGFVVEQDEPFDPLNIGRNRPGTVITGAYHHAYLVKESGPGLILQFSSFMLLGNMSKPERSSQVTLYQCNLLDELKVGITFCHMYRHNIRFQRPGMFLHK